MSQYSNLMQLMKQSPSIDLAFYPNSLLNLRSLFADWVEKQNWSDVLNVNGFSDEQATKSKELLEKALKLLQKKLTDDQSGDAGFELYLRNTETQLKKAYESQPVQFVSHIHDCLEQERHLIHSEMAQEMQTDNNEALHQHIATTGELSRDIKKCMDLSKRIRDVLSAASRLLNTWRADIERKKNQKSSEGQPSNTPGLDPKDVFENGELNWRPYEVYIKLKEELDQNSQQVVKDLQTVLHKLEESIIQWKTHQLHECVRRKPEGKSEEDPKIVESMCEKVCQCITILLNCAMSDALQQMDSVKVQGQLTVTSPIIPAPSSNSRFSMELKDILRKIIEKFLVVLEQPDLTMMIEKEKGQKDKEDINNSKKFSTAVGILGGKGFGENLMITEVEIYLANKRDLAEVQSQGQKPKQAFTIHHEQSEKRRPSSRNLDSPQPSYARSYKDLRVEHFSRRETKCVYKQLYHVVYDVKISIPQLFQEFKGQVISLPVIVRTGANQASEHIGAQLWHSFSSQNMYCLSAEMATSMRVSDVIQMINERILYIGGRGLEHYEREFLQERILMVTKGKGEKTETITLDTFIKEKVTLHKHGSEAEKDTMSFSLWRWLHAIINLLESSTLKKPWLDGIIYGFASREHCTSILRDESEGTFLLRFSESFLSGNFLLAKGALAVVVKKDGQVAFVPPINSDEIEKEGLGRLIEHIRCKHVFGTRFDIGHLHQMYPPISSGSQNHQLTRYMGWCKKEVIMPDEMMGASSSGFQQSGAVGVSKERKPKKAKRRSAKVSTVDTTSSVKQQRSGHPESPESTTSSVASPLSMSPCSEQQFQAVGYKLNPLFSWQSASPSNIPVTVFSHINGNQVGTDNQLGGDEQMEEEQMVIVNQEFFDQDTVELPSNYQFPVATQEVVGASSSPVTSSSLISLSAAIMSSQIPMSVSSSNFMIGSNDPSLLNLQQTDSTLDVDELTRLVENFTGQL